jgi:predicted transcriptional regulator
LYYVLYHEFMATMLSLRLSDEQEKRVTALASRHGITRSQWLRNAIEQQMVLADAVVDSHAIYLGLMADLAGMSGSGRRDGARQHSKVLKRKLNASRRC